MSTKTPTLASPPASTKGSKAGEATAAELAAQWAEARHAYPLYAALALQFEFAELPHAKGQLPPARPTREAFERDLQWMDEIDEKVRAFQIRQLPPETLNASEQSMRAFVHRQLRKPDKTNADRDKIDLLLVQYFALCAPEELYRGEITREDVAEILRPVVADADSTLLDWCRPVEEILDALENCHSLRDLMEHGILEQGRLIKESAGALFYLPAALVAFVRFNFLLRRAFIRLLHADLSAMLHAIDGLEGAGVKAVDCRRAGFSAAETTAKLRHYCENWKQPFQKDYTASSVTHAFEQLLALRADLEEALNRARPSGSVGASALSATEISPAVVRSKSEAPAPSTSSTPKPAAVQVSPPTSPAPKDAPVRVTAKPPVAKIATMSLSEPAPTAAEASREASASARSSKPAQGAASTSATASVPVDADRTLEAIWEQLIAAPPDRGRSMSTVVLQNTKVLLSSWEVAAFVSEGDQEAEDLRRAVVARALLAVAMDERKRSGESASLASALTLARAEVSYFQGRVEQAKRDKNTEAAVNLGISTKRLLSFIEEAEKLQP